MHLPKTATSAKRNDLTNLTSWKMHSLLKRIDVFG